MWYEWELSAWKGKESVIILFWKFYSEENTKESEKSNFTINKSMNEWGYPPPNTPNHIPFYSLLLNSLRTYTITKVKKDNYTT